MKFIYSTPKPLFFGLLGALGCLIGFAFGEPLLTLLKVRDAKKEKGPGAVLLFKNEFEARARAAGGKAGDVEITLMWENINDLDLHCINPAGDHIFFNRKAVPTGGELDVDRNASMTELTNKPVEHVTFTNAAPPLGKYTVQLHHYSNKGAPDPTQWRLMVKADGDYKEYQGSLKYGDPTNTVCTFEVTGKSAKSTLMSTALTAKLAWKSTLVIAVWGAILATCLSFALVMGQNKLMRRRLIDDRGALRLLVGGLIAGFVSGGISQYLFSVAAQLLAAGDSTPPWLLSVGQILGWMALGGLLAAGLAFFIPNLSKTKGAVAGIAGGLIGGIAFLFALRNFGDLAARLVGSALLGIAIGSIVAIVERMAREAALVVHWDENERTVINLGADPVILGSSPEAHLYLPAEKGFPSQAAIVTFRDGVVEMENLMSETRHELHHGNKLEIGGLMVEIQTDAKA